MVEAGFQTSGLSIWKNKRTSILRKHQFIQVQRKHRKATAILLKLQKETRECNYSKARKPSNQTKKHITQLRKPKEKQANNDETENKKQGPGRKIHWQQSPMPSIPANHYCQPGRLVRPLCFSILLFFWCFYSVGNYFTV